MTLPAAPLPSGSRRRGRVLALLLLVVSPVCAEYLQAYDPSTTGNAVALLAGLLVLGPLYGAPALLIREIAARSGLHWTGILALAGAFGVVQAGVVDQSLFATSYPGYEDWDEQLLPTFIAPLGLGAASALNFLGGHVIWSFAAPIALVEGLDRPGPRRAWLGTPGLVAAVVLYVLAALLVWSDIVDSGGEQASPGQLAGALAVAGLLVAAAWTVGRRRLPEQTDARVPRPWVVLVVVLVAAAAYSIVPSTWLGVALGVVILALTGVVVTHWSRSAEWDRRRVAAVAGAVVLVRALVGFASVSDTVPRPSGGFAQNAVLLVLSLLLVVAAVRGGPDRGS